MKFLPSFRQRLDRLSGDLLPNMHLDGTGQTLTLSPVLAGDMLESLFIAEVGPVKDDDSNHDSYVIDDMEVFDLNTEKLHPSSRMVYFALETKAIGKHFQLSYIMSFPGKIHQN